MSEEHDLETLLIGATPVMRALRALIQRVAPTRLPVLIEGPTGSGKELVARAIHLASGRRGRFVALNVAALGDALFEDALFGHVRGAFTGALAASPGYLTEADGGTCLLDEIGVLAMAHQPKLLRAIETHRYRAIGAPLDRASDFRVVAATNESLPRLVRRKRFREDLAFRLSGIVLSVPPLAERREDIPLLVEHFVTQAAAEYSAHRISFTAGALRALQDRAWPGNVRELKHAIDRLIALADDSAINENALRRLLPAEPEDGALAESSDEVARETLREVLVAVEWDTGKAAEILGVDRTTVYRRIGRFGISLPPRASRTGPVEREV